MSSEDGEAEPLPARRDPVVGGERRARVLHQVPEWHAARAGRLAASTLHAGLHELDEFSRHRRALGLDSPHCSDPAARRECLLAGGAEGGTVRQAQAAADTRGKFVRIDRQPHGRCHRSPLRHLRPACRYGAAVPEGHTIHRIARDHGKLLSGRIVEVSSPQGRFSDAVLVDGQRLDRIDAVGKHLFYEWANGLVGHVHLGLFGKFRIHRGAEPPPPVGAVRMRLRCDEATIDLAGPTACTVGDPSVRDEIVARLGPDPLRRDARPQLVFDRISRSRKAIGALLLDQSVICGVGNVYRAEALFVCGIHPGRAGRDCDPAELDALWTVSQGMLRQGVRDNRIITVDPSELPRPRGRRLRRGEATYVYKRDRCLRCTAPIQAVVLAGRPCYFCPTCQPS